MSTKLLLIDADAPFTAELSRALEAQGLDVRVTGDGSAGIDLARDARPDAIVLCVELPRMSGYAVCQRVRKDDALKSVPLVITSSEATPETFENHRKLKVRADAYLHKPFTPAALLDALRGLVRLPPAPPAEDLVTLDDVEELSGEMPLEPLPDAGPAPALPAEDEDLRILDSAFDHIAAEPRPPAPPLPGDEQPMAGGDLRAAAALLPAEDEAAHSEIDKLGEEADRALAALGADEVVADLDLDARALLDEPPPRPPGGESDDLLRAAGIHVTAAEPALAAASARKEEEIRRLEDRVSELLIEAARARDLAERREAEALQLRVSAESLEARLRSAEAEHTSRAAEHGSREAEALRAAEQARSLAAEQVEAARADARREAEAQVEAVRAEARREADLRRQAEEHLARAEEARAQAEERARHAEGARIQAAEALARSEEARAQAESARAAAEQARGEADGARGRAEEEARGAAERAAAAEAELAGHRLRIEETEQAHSLKAAQLAEVAGHRDSLAEKLSSLEAELAGALALRPQLEALRGDLDLARADAESARADAERRATDLQKRVQELEAVNAKHEERIVKAYQKIKSDEKIREKTRKALAIALQLLDERLAAAPAAPAKEGEVVPRRE